MAEITFRSNRGRYALLALGVIAVTCIGVFGLPVFDIEVEAEPLEVGSISEIEVRPVPSIPSYYRPVMTAYCSGPAEIVTDGYTILVTPMLSAPSGAEVVITVSIGDVSKTMVMSVTNDLQMTVEYPSEMNTYQESKIHLDVPAGCVGQELQIDVPDYVSIKIIDQQTASIRLWPTVDDHFELRISLKGTTLLETVSIKVADPIDARITVSDPNPLAGDIVEVGLESNVRLYDASLVADKVQIDAGSFTTPFVEDGETITIRALYKGIEIACTTLTVSNPPATIVLAVDGSVSPGESIMIRADVTPERRASEIHWTVSPDLSTVAEGSNLWIEIPDDFVENGTITVTASIRDQSSKIWLNVTDPEAKHICDVEGLKSISDSPSSHYVLDDNIDASQLDSDLGSFTGILDGCGHSIYGFSISVDETNKGTAEAALFTSNSGIIRNLEIRDSKVVVAPHTLGRETTSAAAILAITNSGTISGVRVKDCSVWCENDDIISQFLDEYGYLPEFGKEGWKEFCTDDYKNRFEEKSQHVLAGGLVSTNTGCISDTKVTAQISAYLTNLRYQGSSSENAKANVGMIAAVSTDGTITDCSGSGTIAHLTFLQHAGDSWLGWAETTLHATYQPGAYVGIGTISGDTDSDDSCSGSVTVDSKTVLYAPVYVLFRGATYDATFSHISYTNTVQDRFT